MTVERASLAAEIERRAHLKGTFRLRSGRVADDYFDKYLFESDPKLLRAIAEAMAPLVPREVQALAGLELGGIPIATMLSQTTGLPALFVRKQAKTYGTCRLAEGGDVRGRHLLLVEDVVTTGGQIIESTRLLRERGATVEHVLVVIDRDQDARSNLQRNGLALHALFTIHDLAAAQRADP